MNYRYTPRLFLLILLAAVLALSGCAAPAASQPTPTQPTTAPTPIESLEPAATEAPGVFIDPQEFKAALLEALMAQDTAKLESWMTFPFLEGEWRADGSDASPEDALRILYSNYLGTENRLELVQGADLTALMGGVDPLSFPRAEAGVVEAVLVSGWGKDGRDEAILYIARAADNNLKWHGWMIIRGGFSGARIGGTQLYTNEARGYRVFLPKDYEISDTNPSSVLVMAPGVGHPGQERAAAFITVEPANGRSVEEITGQIKAELGSGYNIPPGTALALDKAMAIVLSGLPGQDANRQLFVVYNDLLYHITFVPDAPQVGTPYWQMEDLYAMIVNTFHFTD